MNENAKWSQGLIAGLQLSIMLIKGLISLRCSISENGMGGCKTICRADLLASTGVADPIKHLRES
jgi:hypothetical protein